VGISLEPWMLACAEGHNSATGAAEFAQQQLQDRGGPNLLRAGGVLRPATS
jgi:hypothetical protein